ncbi:MAG: RnfABCDGE type electron transport complex subunit G [Muribaculaceae bacterium]|nr:RnfABCDGE type electron transport complex subunit G [Muribaculaceae bacterium]
MVLSLTGLTFAAAAILAGVNLITAKPIEEASAKARAEAMTAILPPFDNDIAATATVRPDGQTVYYAILGGIPAGTAVETYSDNGFSGRITLLAGFDTAGVLTGYRVLEHAETPGLGAKMTEWFSDPSQPSRYVTGRTGTLAVKADGGDIDAITGATITSRAFLEALNRARKTITE